MIQESCGLLNRHANSAALSTLSQNLLEHARRTQTSGSQGAAAAAGIDHGCRIAAPFMGRIYGVSNTTAPDQHAWWPGRGGSGYSFGSPTGIIYSGTTTGQTAGRLIDSGANFGSDVVRMSVLNVDTDEEARVTARNSSTDLSISFDIMGNGDEYEIRGRPDPFISTGNISPIDTLSGNEYYVSFYLRYPSYTADAATFWNAKFFYIQAYHRNEGGSWTHKGAWESCASGPGAEAGWFHQIRNDSGGVAGGGWPGGLTNSWDGNWHRYEYYWNNNAAIFRMWYDGNLLYDRQFEDPIWGGSWDETYFRLSMPSIQAQDPRTFTRCVDDIEIWDRLPTAQPQDTIPPTQPTDLIANPVSSSTINLSWTASTDNVGVAGYQIYRCEGTECTPITLAGTSQTNNFLDTNLNPATTYSYRVRAYDAAGNFGENSSIVFATTFEQIITVEQMINSYKDYRDGGNTLSNFLTTLRKWILFR